MPMLNLIVRSRKGDAERAIAKVVPFKGHTIIHAWVYGNYQRHSVGAWGVRYPLARYADEHDIEDLYFWEANAKKTHHTTLTKLRQYGTPGKRDDYGGTLNLPGAHWETFDFQLDVPWVAKDNAIVLPECVEPWPLPKADKGKGTPRKAPVAPAQRPPLAPVAVQAALW